MMTMMIRVERLTERRGWEDDQVLVSDASLT